MTIRLDQIIRDISDGLCQSIDARLGAGTADKCGVKRIVEAVIVEHGIPTEPIDLPMTLARNVLGILPEAPRKQRGGSDWRRGYNQGRKAPKRRVSGGGRGV